eukprot:6977634-Ditylum_brightwellii.AAC.1
MNVLYSLIKEELTGLLVRFFPDIFSKEALLKGNGLDSLETVALSGMCMEKKGLPYLQRALTVNEYNEDDRKILTK